MADYHLYSNKELEDFGFSREELERLDPERTLCYSISGQEFCDKETRSTNVATAMEKATSEVAVELEEIPSHSSKILLLKTSRQIRHSMAIREEYQLIII